MDAVFKFTDLEVTNRAADGYINTYRVPDIPPMQLDLFDLDPDVGVSQTIVARDGQRYELNVSLKTLPELFRSVEEARANASSLDPARQTTYTTSLAARPESDRAPDVLDDIHVTTGNIHVTVIGG